MSKNSTLSKHSKRFIYTVILRPVLTYVAPVWCTAIAKNVKPLQIFQNKYLQLILNEHRYEKIKNCTTNRTYTCFTNI